MYCTVVNVDQRISRINKNVRNFDQNFSTYTQVYTVIQFLLILDIVLACAFVYYFNLDHV